MQQLHDAHSIARLVLVLFALTIGVAIAAPIVQLQVMQLVCSVYGGMKVLVSNDDGSSPATGYTLQTPMECGIPMGPWRAPGSNVFAWVFHSFIDELAYAGGRDPLEFRLELLGQQDVVAGSGDRGVPYNVGRMRRVLTEVAQKADWGRKKFPRGQGQGIAFHFSHRGYIAEVAEVTVSRAGELKVNRVVVVSDIGSQIVNLSGAENQVQGSVIDGLGTMMFAELDVQRGRIMQGNFTDYPLIRISDAAPRVDVHFLKTDQPVTGLGEPALPPLAPAVCNAIFAATGKRVRQLPLSRADLTWS
jgi:isoquinoline 1-oxidoreductase beta subunit